jgi:23S rRNA (uridine2552-2'-O)-methyltransferase
VYRRKDAFYVRAKAEGYRSRAAFKLEQLDRRFRLFRPSERVVDLGAWPGGWLQVAARAVGSHGRVVGVDLQRIDPLRQPNVTLVQGDVTTPDVQEQVSTACGGQADVVLADLAPKLTGIRAQDTSRAYALAQQALQIATALLRPGGRFVVKLFAADELSAYLTILRGLFADVRTTRPEATRKGSAELYAIGMGFVGAPTAVSAGR